MSEEQWQSSLSFLLFAISRLGMTSLISDATRTLPPSSYLSETTLQSLPVVMNIHPVISRTSPLLLRPPIVSVSAFPPVEI